MLLSDPDVPKLSLNCPECAQLNFVYCSVHEMKKDPKYDILSGISVAVCKTYPTKISISTSQLYPKLSIMDKKGCFLDTLVQLVQNVHRFASCAIGRRYTPRPYAHTAEKRTISLLFASICTKDLEPRWAAPWSNCKQSHALSTNNEVSMTKKHPKYRISSVISVPVCRTRPTKIHISGRQLYRELSSIQRYPWHTSATYTECVPIRLMRHWQSHVTLLGITPIQHES